MITPDGLATIRRYADWIAPEATLVLSQDAAGRSKSPSALVADAHAAGLKVAVWTLRAENVFLPLEHRRGSEPAAYGDLAAYAAAILDADVDAVFSDFPAITVAAAQPPRN